MKKVKHFLGNNKVYVKQVIPDEKEFENPLVLIHGSFGGFFMWKKVAEDLATKGFETFSISLRGHDPSDDVDLSTVTMEDYKDDVALAINELGLKNPVIVGHSFGGLVALMYAKDNDETIKAVIAVDPSPSAGVQGEVSEEKINQIPPVYSAMDAGLPKTPEEAAKTMPDMPEEILSKMKEMLGLESGQARRDRKYGVSIPRESISKPILMISAELGESLPFGIPLESTQKMADYYKSDFVEIRGATHPGVIMGIYSVNTARAIDSWLKKL